MLIAEMIAAVRRDIRENTPITISDAQITTIIEAGADIYWEALLKADESIGRARASLSSYSNAFTIPSNVFRLDSIWDMGTTRSTIASATNATPIYIISAGHPFAEDDIVFQHGVLGNTAANGTWKISYIDVDTFTLDGSVGNGAYTSGGFVFKEESTFRRLTPIKMREATGKRRYEYYIRGDEIILDWLDFSDDLVIDYIRTAENTYNDIPARYRVGLVSYAVTQLARPVTQQDPNGADIQGMMTFHQNRFQGILGNIGGLFDQDGSPIEFRDDLYWDQL